jgi:uncharacterized protein (TIGR00255 family)
MINSMTAFARHTSDSEAGAVTVELRSVNHRYLDCHFKMPDDFRRLEPRFREALTAHLARGKIDCQLRSQARSSSTALEIDQGQLAAVLEAAIDTAAKLDHPAPIDPVALLQFPGVCSVAEPAEEALAALALGAFETALTELEQTRAREGSALSAMVRQRLDSIDEAVRVLRRDVPEFIRNHQAKMRQRIEELDLDADPARLEQELVLVAQKADVDEELDRLEAHVNEVRRVLDKGGPCGRRLDFLMQELNREANTLSSKSLHADATRTAVELKVLIEQMREQIQNIE